MNRTTKEVKSEILMTNLDLTTTVNDRTTINADGLLTNQVYDVSGAGNGKVELFKYQTAMLLKAVKFN